MDPQINSNPQDREDTTLYYKIVVIYKLVDTNYLEIKEDSSKFYCFSSNKIIVSRCEKSKKFKIELTLEKINRTKYSKS